ncbi:MAG TPA: phosphatase PAP2 family protein [Gemmatimonadota bacterium]|nr:phosphatase PAP2 family protein [Gemmatimonadota bacterium]
MSRLVARPRRPSAVPRAALAAALLASLGAAGPGPGPLRAQESSTPVVDTAGSATAATRWSRAAAGARASRRAAPDPAPAPVLERAVGGALGLGMLVALDVPVRKLALDVHGTTGDELSRRARWFGNWHASLPWIVGGTVAVGAATGGRSGLEKAAAVLAGAAAGSAANEIVNEAVGRARPIWGRGLLSFDPLSGHASFPSGHAAYTFAVAGGIDAVTHGWLPAAAAYTVASATALSRVYDDKHWLSDIVVGSLLGATVSHFTATRVLRALRGGDGSRPRADARAPGSPPGPRALPILGPGVIGVSLRF